MLLLAALLRLYHLDAGWFGADQARDLAWAERIASGGPYPTVGPLMRNRFHLGALYYWFWAVPSFVSAEPLAAYAWAALLGTAAVFATWWLTRRLAGPVAALVAAAWLAAGPIAVLDARIAWAPAALPPWTALLLVLATSFLATPSTARAAALLFVAALGTQLHLGAAPATLLAGVAVLWRGRALGVRGLALAGAAGALPLLPMLLALREPLPAAAAAAAASDPWSHRIVDLLLLGQRVLVGLTPADRPRALDAWLTIEGASMALTIAAACFALVRPPRAERSAQVRFVAFLFFACLGAVALLPAEAWCYYLDTTLVPGAIAIGIAWQAAWRFGAARWLLGAVVVARGVLLLWWIQSAATSGFVAANLDYLRLGGPRPVAPDARARLANVATKREIARILTQELAIPLERLWHDVHGSGFADVDTDNGFFLRRAAADAISSRRAEDRGLSALVTYRGDFPPEWLARMGEPHVVGPLEVRGYRPAIAAREAQMTNCGDAPAPLPATLPPDPLAYGSGEPAWPAWPCAAPAVAAPVAPRADATVRIFARTEGAARVVDVRSEPPGTPQVSAAPGAGVGIELPSDAARLTVRLEVDGPARLDLVELHGVR